MARATRASTRALAVAQEARTARLDRGSSALSTLLRNHNRKLTRRQEKLADEVYTRVGAAHGALIIHEFTTQALGQAHLQAQHGFVQTVRQLNAVTHAAYLDEDTARDVADWTASQREMARRHFSSNLEGVASQLIGLTSTNLSIEDEEPQGFLARLFG